MQNDSKALCGCVIGVNCEVTPISKVLFQLLLVIPRCCFPPPAASQTQQINTVLIACKLTVVYWEIREKQEKQTAFTHSFYLRRSTTATPTLTIRTMMSWPEADQSRRRSPSCLFVSIVTEVFMVNRFDYL